MFMIASQLVWVSRNADAAPLKSWVENRKCSRQHPLINLIRDIVHTIHIMESRVLYLAVCTLKWLHKLAVYPIG
jgi:hypothetical protein